MPSKFEYHGDPEKTAAAFNDRGWGSLGDVGWVDEDGYLYLTDRVSNMIISGGVNIYPRELEDVLVGHPDIADAAVIGVPHPDMGEAVRAIVEPAGPVDDEDVFAARAHRVLPERLSHFKCPTTVAVVEHPAPPADRQDLQAAVRRTGSASPIADGVVVETDLADA